MLKGFALGFLQAIYLAVYVGFAFVLSWITGVDLPANLLTFIGLFAGQIVWQIKRDETEKSYDEEVGS